MSTVIHLGLPQIVYLGWTAWGLFAIARLHDKPTTLNINHAIVGSLITIAILAWGGFFS